MKLLFIFLALLVTTASFAQSRKLEIGTGIPMADTKMKSVDGKEYSIKDAEGKNGTLVMFSCNTCPYVVKYQGRTEKAINAAREKGFGVIIINSNEAYRNEEDSYDAMKAYAKKHGYKNVPYVVDVNSVVADAFMANRTPETFLFDASGKLVYHGAIDNEPNNPETTETALINALNEVASGKDVTVKETRSIGCMIKRKDS